MVGLQQSLLRMTVCQTCGDKGYSQLLVHCMQCQIVAVHRYCMDGPSTIDEEEVSWYCEDCVPRVVKTFVSCRKSERVGERKDREALRRKARRKWSNLSLLEAEKTDNVKDGDLKVTNHASNWNHECINDGVHDEQQRNCDGNMAPQLAQVPVADNLKTSAISERKNESSPSPHEHSFQDNESALKVTNHASNCNHECSNDGFHNEQQGNCDENMTRHLTQVPDNLKTNPSAISERKNESSPSSQHEHSLHATESKNLIVLGLKSREPHERSSDTKIKRCRTVPLRRQKKDLFTEKIVRKMRTKSAVLTREKESDRSSYGDVEDQQEKLEKNVAHGLGDSILEKDDKHEKSLDEVDSKLVEVNDISNSLVAKQSDNTTQEPEVVEEAIGSFHDHRGEDVQSCCTITECRSSRKKRRLVIEMEYSDDDDTINAVTEPSSLKSSNDGDIFCTSSSKPPVKLGTDDHAPPAKPADHIPTLSSLVTLAKHVLRPPSPSKLVDHVPSQPIIDVIWRGGCGISNNIDPISFELEAHVSNKALPAVYGAASALPKIIDFEIVSKRYVWPKSFEKSPPTGEIVGLYFFPVGERDEIMYQNLLAKMIDRHLMLMSQINNLELLVFCSRELPKEEWRFQRKYYLWGVFRQKQEAVMPIKAHTTQIYNSRLSVPVNLPKDDVCQKQRDSNHNTVNRFPESANRDNLNHSKPVFSSQTYNTQLDRVQHYGSHNRRNHHQISRKISKHHAESDGYAYENRKASYHVKVRHRRHRDRGHDAIMIRPVQSEPYRSEVHYRRHRGHENYD